MSVAHRAAGITGEAGGVRGRSLARLLLKLPLHVLAVLVLQPHALFNPPLGVPEGFFLQLLHQLGIERRLLGADIVQVADAVHVALRGCHVQRRVVVVVQTPDVGTDRYEEGKAATVTVGRCQVERCVAPYVALVRVSSERDRSVSSNLYFIPLSLSFVGPLLCDFSYIFFTG